MAFAQRHVCLLAAALLPVAGYRWSVPLVHAAGSPVEAHPANAPPPATSGPAVNSISGSGELATEILERTGIQGGLVVHLGSGNGRLTAALGAGNAYLVHGLDSKADNVEEARRHVRSVGLYGKVSIERYRGKRLPYVDNLVNLAVVEDVGAVSAREIQRVLAPGGVAYVKSAEGWSKTVKARPPAIDEWTHCLYDASNNAVSDDQLVAPPNQLQWVARPKWARSHDHLASVSVAVSAAGRLLYIVDEAPTAAVVLQPEWHLVARDAFSGVVLWKRPIESWQWHLRGFRSGPSALSRRLVAVGDRVFVTLGIDAPVCALDAATGQTITTYAGTDKALELVYREGTLFVVGGDRAIAEAVARSRRRGKSLAAVRSQRPAYQETAPTKHILAVDASTGKVLWKKCDSDTAELMPTTLAVNGGRLLFQNPDEILCLQAQSGKEIWRAARPVSRHRPTWSAPTLVAYGDVILSADRAVAERQAGQDNNQRKVEWIVTSAGGQAPVGRLIAFSAKDGKRLWDCQCRECYNAPVDVLVSDGLVWTGELVGAREPGITAGRDPVTGEVKRSRPHDQDFFLAGMGHGRCHRNRATNRYLVLGRSGIELIDVATGVGIANHWTRGTCQYGVIPCNGLLYVPPHACACFITAKLNSFNCFAPEQQWQPVAGPAAERLEQGRAYKQVGNPIAACLANERGRPTGGRQDKGNSLPTAIIGHTAVNKSEPNRGGDWPTYRHDAGRSGRTPAAVPAALEDSWHVDLGGKLTSIVIAEGKLFVAQVDDHTVHALNADTGSRIWSYTVGGRVDSPPTISDGRALFGSADGWVYCLRVSDGVLAWRFRAAPNGQRIVAYGQLESAWPVHGSVLVRDGTVYCAAGRSSYLEGGIRMYRLDAQTGRLLSETTIDHRDPETGHQRKGVVQGTNMPGALPDVLSFDGQSIYMRHTRFDLNGQLQPAKVDHLFSPAGFLDDSWWHRTYWLVGTKMGTNYGGWPQPGDRVPAGRLLVVDEASIYGFGRNQYIHHGAHIGIDGATVYHFRPDRDSHRRFTHYRAFAIDREPPAGGQPLAQAEPPRRRPDAQPNKYRWTGRLPVLARAMLLAHNTLFLAGPPSVLASKDPAGALAGTEGGGLIVLSAADGKQLATYQLDSPPVFDGMAAAAGRLYMATMDGNVICFAGK